MREKKKEISKLLIKDRGEIILKFEVIIHLCLNTHLLYLMINILISTLGLFINQV